MKWLKKILRIIAIILPCFVALSITTPSFAKSYDITSFNVYPYAFFNPNHSSSNLGKVPIHNPIHIYLNDMTDIHPRRISIIDSTYNSTSDKCIYSGSNTYHSVTNISGNSIVYGESLIIPKINVVSPLRNDPVICHTLFPYNHKTTSNVSLTPEFANSTIPYNETMVFNTYLPYNTLYSTINFSSTRKVNGVEYSNDFYISDLLNASYDSNGDTDRDSNYKYYANRITQAFFPLNFDPTLEEIVSGNDIVISGEIYNVNTPPYLYAYFIDPTTYQATEVHTQCAYIDYTSAVRYSCRITSPITTSMYGFNLHLVNSGGLNDFSTKLVSSSNILCDSSSDSGVCGIHFSNISITLNGDSTVGGSGSLDSRGNYPNVSPGSPRPTEENADWFTSLVNMFAFNFTNPFSALFTLFTDNNSCVNIPNLAGMLHAEDTQYCPWFDSTTRNILTPVLGISSVMLVFGFLVRWLGSSSGNMFDDETGGGALSKNTFVGRRRK